MAKYRISKVDAGRRQLECAIRLYFNSADTVSIHTLASAARNVLINLCEHRGESSQIFRKALVESYVKEESRKEVFAIYRNAENFFKHADRDPDRLLSFDPQGSDYVIFEATEAYLKIVGELTPDMLSFRTWWLLINPFMHSLLSDEVRAVFEKSPYRSDQKLLFYTDVTPKWVGNWK